jgi:hypothetical protein
LRRTRPPRPAPGCSPNKIASEGHLPGGVRERPNRHDWKSCVGQPTVGSNPTLSAQRRSWSEADLIRASAFGADWPGRKFGDNTPAGSASSTRGGLRHGQCHKYCRRPLPARRLRPEPHDLGAVRVFGCVWLAIRGSSAPKSASGTRNGPPVHSRPTSGPPPAHRRPRPPRWPLTTTSQMGVGKDTTNGGERPCLS